MQAELQVRKLHDWAIVPEKRRVDRKHAREEAESLSANFRYHRKFRYPEACPPWVMGQELGWQIMSPITVNLTPVEDVQTSSEEDPAAIGRLLDVSEFWQRGDGFVATKRNDWIRSFQYRGTTGGWEAMFLPNGDGTVEWHLGWAARIPDESLLLVLALDGVSGIEIPTGILTSRQVNKSWDGVGLSVAMRPLLTRRLNRGEAFARIVVLPASVLQTPLTELA